MSSMKYANIVFDGNRKGSVNIGDDLQLLAIDNMYKQMGIASSEIVRIGLSELTTYDGEYVILPISFPLYGYREKMYITMFSPKIIPVFLALSIMSSNISEEECIYLRRFEPIGCRDYHTVKILRSHNIMAYLNGCMTATLPKRDNLNGKNVYIVDLPKKYFDYIPDSIKKDAVIKSQILDCCEKPEKEMQELLDEYADNASLVITTRLHCAMPCVAMGLPVVLMKDRYSFRFPFISRYLHVYEKEEFDRIDWNPSSIEYEDEKISILEMAIMRVKEAFNKYASIFNVSYFYEKDNIREDYYIEHFDNVKEYIDATFDKEQFFEYAIWGITQKADMICEYLSNNYPNSKLVYVYDQNKQIQFHGILSGNDTAAICKKDVFVFVTTATANIPAIDLFASVNKKNFQVSDDGIERIGITNNQVDEKDDLTEERNRMKILTRPDQTRPDN